MPNLFLNIPIPAANGAGAAVDVSAMAATKTIIVGGPFRGSVSLEYATDDTATQFAPVPSGTFNNNPGRVTVDLAVRWLRAVMSSYKSGAANVDVGGVVDGDTSFAQLSAVPADVSSMPAFKTVVSSGAGIVEISQDGVSWSQVFSFNNAGGQSGSFVAAFARCSGSTMWMGGADLGEDDDQIPQPPFPVPLINTTIFVNDGGNDDSGNGSFANPYLTLDRARRDIPNPYPPGNRYFIDATGINEVLTPGYRLPAFKGPVLFDTDLLSPYFIYMAGINIDSTPRLTTLLSAADATVGFADIVSQVIDPITEKQTITIFPARPAWAGNALKGKQAQGTAGGFDSAVIYESAPTYIKVLWPFPLTAGPAITITEPSAYFTGTDTDSWGCLVAQNSDSIAFRNVSVKDQFGGYGLGMEGPGVSIAIRCELESPDFERLSGVTSRYGKDWITGFPFIAGVSFVPHCLFDQCVGFPTIFVGPGIPDIVGCVFDGCDPVDFKYFTPGVGFGAFEDAICAVPAMNISTTIIRNGIGDGVRFHGTCGVIENCDIYNNAGDGVNVGLGAGTLQIKNSLSSGAPNLGVGVRGADGMTIKVDAATSGAATPLTGVGGDIKMGNRPVRTWANFIAGVGGPALEELDLTVVAGAGGTAADAALAPAYVTGTGTRLYQ